MRPEYKCRVYLMRTVLWMTLVTVHPGTSAPTVEQEHQLDEMAHDEEHLQEHMTAETGRNVTDMSTSEKEFYFFQSHDENGDRKLDGLELYHSMEHVMAHSRKAEKNATARQEKITAIVDKMLESEDLNRDGYIDYPEYALKRQQDALTRPPRDQRKPQRPQWQRPQQPQQQGGSQPNQQFQQPPNQQFQQPPNQQFQQPPNQQFQQPPNQQFQQQQFQQPPNQQFQQQQFQQPPNQQFQQPPNQQFQQQSRHDQQNQLNQQFQQNPQFQQNVHQNL